MTATLDRPLDTGAAPSTAWNWTRPALYALLAATAVLYLWGLSGWANSFYSAAAQAGSQNWEAFFFGSSDAANSITVDKPPAAIWIMALSVRLFGLSSWSILMPQALMGVAAALLVYLTVSRYFGKPAGLLAGAILATTPAATLMFRFNNPDALLELLLVAATYAVLRALEQERLRWIALAGVAVGFAFLTKSLQAFLVLPGFVAAVLLYSGKRLRMLALAAVAVIVSAGWWVAIVELVPESARPYVGGSQTNSALELILGYNGLGRLTGDEAGSVGGDVGGGGGWGVASWHRMFDADWAGQIAWLLPAAFAAIAIVWLVGRERMQRASVLIWGGWLLVTWAVFSLSAGIIHTYYAVALAPAIAALTAMAVTVLWRARHYVPLGALLGGAALYGGTLLLRSDYAPLGWVVLIVGIPSAITLGLGDLLSGRVRTGLVAAMLAVTLVGPLAFSLETASRVTSGSLPTAGPAISGASAQGRPGGGPGGRTGGPGGQAGQTGGLGGLLNSPDVSSELVNTLNENAQDFTWVAAGIGSQTAAGYQLATGNPVMPIGGFNGSDPSPTLEQFQEYVAQGKIHWFIGGSPGGPAGMGGPGGASSSEISTWVTVNFESTTVDGVTLYDLTA